MDVKRKAVALRYDRARDLAPRVVAKGREAVAEAIIRTAQEHRVSVVEQPELVDALLQLEVDEVIPESLYQAVAEVLAFVYQTRQPASDREMG
ncbi:MAG: EscU/YscU/HrcU family type III secretion system export apparatus switch protein [Alicyclobacillus herbarius]|uniref:EscU/YscU/HrcU family type III secretion system export apparatus switch protein n=1 Tax=Alicyclobacillus herbarius TaxID=122960 RepID=UPI00047E1F3D|nr:EscU/YscU/HrcU family type III secretion system export apparatus switch protein [Alicyclobacillus herbarius]MCL6632341.1 EscU/YscU/HrcU family type III secretion system export apparatus switch protein [Alicyclobacillus herbarius]